MIAMATQSNKEHFLSGLAKAFEDQWLVDVRLKAGDNDEDSAISAHKLILVSFFYILSLLFIIRFSILTLEMLK